MRRIVTAALACALVVACSPTPSVSPSGSPATSPTVSTATPAPTPGTTPGEPTASLPVHGSARDLGERIMTAAAPVGGVFVSIPAARGSVLALLDHSGTPRPGWPITVEGSTSCPGLFPLPDGSVRLLCEAAEDEAGFRPLTAFAFDGNAMPLPGWPVELGSVYAAWQLVGDTVVLLRFPPTDIEVDPQPFWLVTVGRDGAIVEGAQVLVAQPCCEWAIGPDGVAYGTARVGGLDGASPEISQLVAVAAGGGRADPVRFPGLAAPPTFATDGRVLVTTGSLVRPITQIHAFEAATGTLLDSSPELDTVTAGYGGTGGCDLENPTPPLVAGDGTIYVLNWAARVFALDPSLQLRQGWPYGPATPLALRDSRYVREDAFCPSPAIPAAGPDGTLYLPLEESPATDAGGSIIALGPDGRLRDGWPVTIQRADGEFWSVATGSDGTSYALAVELESPTTSSATVVGLAPDSTVLFSTTIVDP